MSLFIR